MTFFLADDILLQFIKGRWNPAPCTKRKERAARLPRIKVKGSGQESPFYTTLGRLLCVLKLGDLDEKGRRCRRPLRWRPNLGLGKGPLRRPSRQRFCAWLSYRR